jgi:hypothetical protein
VEFCHTPIAGVSNPANPENPASDRYSKTKPAIKTTGFIYIWQSNYPKNCYISS